MDINKLTDLILSDEEISFFGFNTKFEPTRNLNKEHTNIYTVDCEYVNTVIEDELGCVTIIDWDKNVILNELVRPSSIVTDYVTDVTGFTEDTFKDVMMTTEHIRKIILTIIDSNDIICGCHLYNDFNVLGIYHDKIIDTAILYNHPDGPPNYFSLKYLASLHLHRVIQEGIHNSIEDCIATRDLINDFVDKKYCRTTWKYIGQTVENPDEMTVYNALVETMLIPITYDNIISIYLRGSRGISTNKETSDWDFVVVVQDCITVQEDALIKYKNMDIVLYTESYFKTLCREQTIWAFECIYAPNDKIYKEEINFRTLIENYYDTTDEVIWLNDLKKSVCKQSSRKSGSSKRFNNMGLFNSAKKHMFIGLRFLMYGFDIINHKRIPDITAYNYIWYDILEDNNFDYNKYKKIFKEKYALFKTMIDNKSKKVIDNNLYMFQ